MSLAYFMAPHVCTCYNCTLAEAFQTGPREGPNHIAIRFGTEWSSQGTTFWVATLYGILVPNLVEARPGDRGAVVFHPPAVDSERGHVCFECALYTRGLDYPWCYPRKEPRLNIVGQPMACVQVRYGAVATYEVPREIWRGRFNDLEKEVYRYLVGAGVK